MQLTGSGEQAGKRTEVSRVSNRKITFGKIMEISFWGTLIWGILRTIAHYFRFTPYGIGAFARPFLGIHGDKTAQGITIGTITLFVIAVAATLVYSLLFARFAIWWGGLVYGLAFLLLIGYFFHMGTWYDDTLSMEMTWFLTFGLFIGMSLSAERNDRE